VKPEQSWPKASRSLCLLSGLLIGAAAAGLQLWLLRWGVVAADQLLLYWVAFVGLGLVLAALGSIVDLVVGKRGRHRCLFGLLLPLAAFAGLIPLNHRPLPDVYLLVTDATRADHLSLYGYERQTTPFLEVLADESVVFQQGIAQATHTIVSVPSLLASCYPSQHGMTDYRDVLSRRFKLLPEYLTDSGYRSYGFVTNPHLSLKNGFKQGFAAYDHAPRWQHASAAAVNETYLQWLDQQTDAHPIFALLFYIDPHNPYEPPERWQRLFDPEWQGPPVSNWKQESKRPEPAQHRNLIAQYDGAIAYWDQMFREFVGELKKRDRWDNALIVYTSDHGEAFWEHGFWGHNKALYESLIHVPLVISFPPPLRFPPLGRHAGVVDEVVSGVDVLPTVLDFLRIPPNQDVVGQSALRLAFGGKSTDERVAYCEEILTQYGPYDIRGVRTKRYKYMRIYNFEGDRSGKELLFDLQEDPAEQNDRAATDPQRVAQYRRLVDQYRERIASKGTETPKKAKIDAATRQQLKSLGYVE
jgi:arylsulfatase A-like enzyme